MISNRLFSIESFLFLQAIHIFFFFCFLGPVNSCVLFASGLVCIVLYGLLIKNEILRTAIIISPFIFLFSFLNWIIGIIPLTIGLICLIGIYLLIGFRR